MLKAQTVTIAIIAALALGLAHQQHAMGHTRPASPEPAVPAASPPAPPPEATVVALVAATAATTEPPPVGESGGDYSPAIPAASETPIAAERVQAARTTDTAARYVEPEVFRAALEAAGFPAPTRMVAVGLCESGVDRDGDGIRDALDRFAVGSAGERGPLQIHPSNIALILHMGYSWDAMFEVGPNVAVGRELLRTGGYSQWSCA